MAEVVNLQAGEYNSVRTNIVAIHKEVIVDIQEIMQDIRSLLDASDGFHVDKINERIELLLSEFETGVFIVMQQSFETVEKSMDNFAGMFVNTDTAC